MEYFYIESSRLRLIPLTYDLLLLQSDSDQLAQELGLTSCHIETEEPFHSAYRDALENFWKPNILKHPDQYEWYTNWMIVLKSSNKAIGGIGLSGLPNEHGETETGYAIDLHQRCRGYASEALACLTEWVFAHEDARALVAHTYLAKNPSQSTLLKCGFTLVGPEVTEDGEVYLWRKQK